MENPYWVMLASGLREAGIEILEEQESHKLGWLFKNRKKVDVLHFHHFQSLYCNSGHTRARLVYVVKFALYLLFADLLGYRTILTLHNLKPTHPLKPDWIDFLGHWVAANLTQRVIVHCDEARQLMAARYGRKNNVYKVSHPNYIDYYPNNISKRDAREKLNLPEKARVFLFLGGVRPNKGIETLIEAFINLTDDDLILLIAGKAETKNGYPEQLQRLAEKDTRISLHFGFIPDEELQVFYNACDLVVLPFAWILTSSSTILAMSYSKPVIAPKMGCIPELVEPDVGWLFEPGDVNSLEQIMRNVASDEIVQKGKNALIKATDLNKTRFIYATLRCYGVPTT